ncbi:MAG: hypothetical protein ABWX88_04355 [Pseudoxanthomonas sp.]
MTQASFEIVFSTHPFGLKAKVSGQATFENTLAYWRAISAELSRQPANGLLLIDETTGAALSEEHWRRLVEGMKDGPLDKLRIAHVKPRGLERIEYCELFALEAGMHARVFTEENEALLWLRHGLS